MNSNDHQWNTPVNAKATEKPNPYGLRSRDKTTKEGKHKAKGGAATTTPLTPVTSTTSPTKRRKKDDKNVLTGTKTHDSGIKSAAASSAESTPRPKKQNTGTRQSGGVTEDRDSSYGPTSSPSTKPEYPFTRQGRKSLRQQPLRAVNKKGSKNYRDEGSD
jgi:hypothetical protein